MLGVPAPPCSYCAGRYLLGACNGKTFLEHGLMVPPPFKLTCQPCLALIKTSKEGLDQDVGLEAVKF